MARSTAWPETERLLLANVRDVDHVGDIADYLEQLLFALGFERVLQLKRYVEVILNGGLAAAGDDDDVLNAGMHGFLDAVLDEGLVHQREHLLGLRLGGGKKSRAQSCGGEDCFAHFRNHVFEVLFSRLCLV